MMSARNRNRNPNNSKPNSDAIKSLEGHIHERPSRSQKRERDLLYLENDSDDDDSASSASSSSSGCESAINNEESQHQKESPKEAEASTTTENSPSPLSPTNQTQKCKSKGESESNDSNKDDNNSIVKDSYGNGNNSNKRSSVEEKEQTPPKKKAKAIKPLFKPLETPGPDGKLYEGPVPTLPEILDTLLSHFIPDPYSSEFKSFEEMLVPMEEAWWYYTDIYCETFTDEENVPKLGFRSFVHKMFDLCPSLADLKASINNFSDIDEIVSGYSKYKSSIPCAGIIILDSSLEQVLLVKGAWKGAKWGFPKGKLKTSENPLDGALREVKEEIGVEIRSLIDPSFRVTKICGGKNITMFLACNVPWSGSYAPKVRNEISCIEWHRIATITANRVLYANVYPFLTPLERWVAAESKKRNKKASSPPNRPSSSSSSSSSSRKDGRKRSSPSSSPTHSPVATYAPPFRNEGERFYGNNDLYYNYNGPAPPLAPPVPPPPAPPPPLPPAAVEYGYGGYPPSAQGYPDPQQYQYYDNGYGEYNANFNGDGNVMNVQNQQYDIYQQQQQQPPPPQYYQDAYQQQYYPDPQYAGQPEMQPPQQYMDPAPAQYYPPEYPQSNQNIPPAYSNVPQNVHQNIPPMDTHYPQQEAPVQLEQPPLPPPSPLPPPPPPTAPEHVPAAVPPPQQLSSAAHAQFQQEQYQGYQQHSNVPITNKAMAASVSRKLNERRRFAQNNQQFGGNYVQQQQLQPPPPPLQQQQQQDGRFPSFLA